jgi:HK97 family phage portal protein
MKNPLKTLATKAFIKLYLKSAAMDYSQMLPTSGGKPEWGDWTTGNAVKNGYKQSIWVYAAINRKASAAASVPWKVYRLDQKTGEWEEQKNHPLEQLIEKPNAFMSRKDLIERITAHLNLGGNALQKKVRAAVGPQKGRTIELWPIGPDGIKPLPDKAKFISGYEVKNEKGQVQETIDPKDLLHFMLLDPANPYWGLGPLQVAARTVDTDNEAVKWNKVALQNRAVTDGVFTFDNPLHQEEWEEARRQIRAQHQGSNNAREPWVLGSGARWNQMSLSPAEMDFIQSRKMTRDEIAAVFDVPPPMIGLYENATLANIETARKIFWLDTVIPYLEDLQNSFNLSLTPEFQQPGEILELRYDVSNVEALQENYGEKLGNADKLFKMGVPLKEVNRRLELGLEEVPGWEVGFLPTGLVPVTMAADPAAVFPDDDPPEDPKDPPVNTDPNNPPDPDPALDPQKDPAAAGKNNGAAATKKTAKLISFPAKVYAGLDLADEEQTAAFWKSYERERLPFYNRMQKQVNRLFEDQATKAAKAYEKGGEKAALEAIEKTEAAWKLTYKNNYLAAIEHFGSRAFNDLMKHYGPDHTKAEEEAPEEFDPYERLLGEYIATTTATKVTRVLEFTKQTIAAIIKEMRDDNATVDQVARRIRDEIGLFTTHRSFRIARTEIVSASNYASLQAAEQTGMELEKRWVTSRDSRVREAHEDIDRETVPLDGEFSNGLLHPGDMRPGTPAKEVVHCRCALSYTRKRRPSAA